MINASSSQPGVVNANGGSGHDTIVSRISTPNRTVLDGEPGDDILAVHGQPAFSPSNSPTKYTLNGGDGDDTLIGGQSDDIIDAGDGRDFIGVAGGGTDTATCGAGIDILRYDSNDTVGDDCEIRLGPDGSVVVP